MNPQGIRPLDEQPVLAPPPGDKVTGLPPRRPLKGAASRLQPAPCCSPTSRAQHGSQAVLRCPNVPWFELGLCRTVSTDNFYGIVSAQAMAGIVADIFPS